MIVPVILSGGSGTRLWPLSRKSHPKQYLKLSNNSKSLLQNTLLRLPKGFEDPLILTNEEHRFIVIDQLKEISILPKDIYLEPIPKNTAPAITIASMDIYETNPEAVLVVLSSDHHIENIKAFHDALDVGIEAAKNNHIVTLGINPTKPETGYGYIKFNQTKEDIFKIESFTEKPSQKIANQYIESGDYLWNSGMFIFKAKVLLEELSKFEPKIYSSCKKIISTKSKVDKFIRFNQEIFENCPEKSIDHAVMERTEYGYVVPLDAKWSDLGSWSSIWDISPKDKNLNSFKGDIVSIDSVNSVISSEYKLTALIGVNDFVVVDTPDALLIANKKNIADISKIIDLLKSFKRPELIENKKVHRPWGCFTSIEKNNSYQVKQLVINPGEKISLQKHQRRSEHWIVISGIATVTRGESITKLYPNQSTFIPIGEIHRLENQEKEDLIIVEIQTGEYFGEDDIIRLDDDYQRR